jgi:anti-sigma regulatory factor (Ser/Thr protein kinase)
MRRACGRPTLRNMNSRKFAAEPAAVTQARRFTEESLQKWNAQAWGWTAALLVTELAANAVVHAKTAFEVALSFDGVLLTVGVTDQSARAVCPRPLSDLATTGRGLPLIDQLSVGWGVHTGPASKTVWCTIAASDEERATDTDLMWTEGELELASADKPQTDHIRMPATAAA